jgi:hypothetical protein
MDRSYSSPHFEFPTGSQANGSPIKHCVPRLIVHFYAEADAGCKDLVVHVGIRPLDLRVTIYLSHRHVLQ